MHAESPLCPDRPAAENKVVLRDARTGRWLTLTDARQIVSTSKHGEVAACLHMIEDQVVNQGMTAAGFLAYEAAPAFDAALAAARDDNGFPLLWFGLFGEARYEDLPEPLAMPPDLAWDSSISRSEYEDCLRRIQRYIASGDTYQVNYTYRLRAPFTGDAWSLFLRLAALHAPEFGGYLQTPDWTILSLSPELFFRLEGEHIESIPMKGTIGRGLSALEDRAQGERLQSSGKDRAENVMIVDMVRNDLARIALPASIRVEQICALRRYPTLWQMVSPVTARTSASLADIFAALFPAASITGAPKARTMAIIKELEAAPRRIYTGTLGFFLPERRAQFNVAIRTLLIDRRSRIAEYGVGGGIVADSSAASEWQESRIKSLVCRQLRPDFSLLETLLWTPENGYVLLPEHLRRLQASAEYFFYPCDPEAIRAQLLAAPSGYHGLRHKVRALLDRKGALRLEAVPWVQTGISRPVRLALAPQPIDPQNVFLYHKTSNRELYEGARAALPPGADDVLFYNQRGELTETTIANIVFAIDGQEYTPPVHCGLLPGTHRQHLLDTGQLKERVLTLDHLRHCGNLTLINAVRGRYPGVLVPAGPGKLS